MDVTTDFVKRAAPKQGGSLSESWTGAIRLLENLSSILPVDAEYETRVHECIDAFIKTRDMIRHLGLFSPNEILDDIPVSSLRYATIEYYLGEAHSKVQKNRIDSVDNAERHYRAYLDFVRHHQLLTDQQDIDIVKSLSKSAPKDPAAQRNKKITIFQREKELKNTKESLEQFVTKFIDHISPDEMDIDDEEKLRNYFLTDIALKVLQTVDNISMLMREKEMLQIQMSAPPPSSSSGISEDRTDKVNQPSLFGMQGPLLNPKGQPLRPFVITSEKTRLDIKAGVFRPHWNLPTMTIDEYLQKEAERGNILTGGGPASGQIGEKQEQEKDDDDDDDEALRKKREWDDFKDDNPRGWGNRGNKG